jgi:hypothetical protein
LCFTSDRCISSISVRSLIWGAHTVCVCVTITILDLSCNKFLMWPLARQIRLWWCYFQ